MSVNQAGPHSDRSGFCYVINDAAYAGEMLESLKTLLQVMPDVPVCCIIPDHVEVELPATVERLSIGKQYSGPICKVEAIRAPFDRVALVDTDTYFVRDIREIFELLDRYDLAAAHDQLRGWDYDTEAPKAFTELNTGLVVFRRTPRMRQFFSDWEATYREMNHEQALQANQPSFRQTLWNSEDVRHTVLTSEYHFITKSIECVTWDVGLIHGRSGVSKLASHINRQPGRRVYVPGLGLLHGFRGRKYLIRSFFQVIRSLVRNLVVTPREEPPVKWHKPKSKSCRD